MKITKDEALEMCLEYIVTNSLERRHVRWAIKEALAQPERTWVGLTIEDKKEYIAQDFGGSRTDAMDWTEQRLKEKNACLKTKH